MSESTFQRAARIFLAARERTGNDRAAYVAEHCAGDADLRELVDELLRGDERPLALGPLSDRLRAIRQRVQSFEADLPDDDGGTLIGPYLLLRRIGEGAFGTVYLAEQEEPLRRRVALKILRAPAEGDPAAARFDAERQALALMDHPNICRIYDAGATPDGRPYFAMELVHGDPITRYCDSVKLSVKGRLRLMVAVCAAVQHAHQKGIIHRDIKPSNVLIAMRDGVAVPKIIDFGIAKALHRRPDGAPLTERREFIGTPAYMSPEQAGRTNLDVDTRSDVYSLGALLYELLTGAPPIASHAPEPLHDREPPRPSTCVEANAAAMRGTTVPELTRLLQGDLDWITLRCLERDRTRRYGSAGGLGEDLARFLSDEPVAAGPPDAIYRIRKFYRRNRLAVAAGTTTLLALVAGLALALSAMRDARRERDRAMEAQQVARNEAAQARAAERREREQRGRAERSMARFRAEIRRARTVDSFMRSVIEAGVRGRVDGHNFTVRELLDEASSMADQRAGLIDPDAEAAIRESIANAYTGLAMFDAAERHLRQALLLRRRGGRRDAAVARVISSIAVMRARRGRAAEGVEWAEESLAVWKGVPEDDRHDEDYVDSLESIASVFQYAGNGELAERMLREVVAARRELRGEDHTVAGSMVDLARTIARDGPTAESEKLLTDALAILRRTPDAVPGKIAFTLRAIADMHLAKDEPAEAERLLREALALWEKTPGPGHPIIAFGKTALARARGLQGDDEGAAAIAAEAIALLEKTLDKDHPAIGEALIIRGRALTGLARFDEAQAALERGFAIAERNPTPRLRNHAIAGLVELHEAAGRPDDAEAWRRRFKQKSD